MCARSRLIIRRCPIILSMNMVVRSIVVISIISCLILSVIICVAVVLLCLYDDDSHSSYY